MKLIEAVRGVRAIEEALISPGGCPVVSRALVALCDLAAAVARLIHRIDVVDGDMSGAVSFRAAEQARAFAIFLKRIPGAFTILHVRAT